MNNAVYEVKRKTRKKSHTVSYTQHRAPPVLAPSQLKRGNEDMRNKGVPQRKQETNKKKQERIKINKKINQIQL